MYAAPFEYVRASSWADAVGRLEELGEDARVIAGGQSLVPMMMLRLAEPAALIDVAGAAERSLERRNGSLVISALTRHVELERDQTIRAVCPILSEAARLIGNLRVRHRGTIGGSLAHAEATAELPCVAVALGGSVHTLGPSGPRSIPASQLFVTHLTTALEPSEVITGIELPVLAAGQGSAFLEMARRPGDFALAEVAALITLGDGGRCTDARVVVSAVADRPLDVSTSALEVLADEVLDERLAGAVGTRIGDEVEVGPSTHAGTEYRRRMIAVLAKRALLRAAQRAGQAEPAGGGEA